MADADGDHRVSGVSAKSVKSASDGSLAKDRGCTDCWCLLVLLGAWGGFLIITFVGFKDGNPERLYLPRDYSGAYCGVADNWNGGPNLKKFPSLSYTSNLTATVDIVVKDLLCTDTARIALTEGPGALLLNNTARQIYLCACCIAPCARCKGSYPLDSSSSVSLQASVSGKMDEIRGLTADPGSLFSPSGFNGDAFSNMWSEATKYFNMVCLSSCNVNFDTVNGTVGASGQLDYRTYSYELAPDEPLYPYWMLLNESGPKALKDLIASKFTFKALPESICNYHPSKCVPLPGLEFKEITSGYCSFHISKTVTSSLGSSTTDTFASVGIQAYQKFFSNGVEFGNMFGDLQKSLDAFAVVGVLCFVVGFAYIIVLRFCVGICVWTAITLVWVLILLGGGLSWVRSGQCQGKGLFETGQQTAVAVATYGQKVAKENYNTAKAVATEYAQDYLGGGNSTSNATNGTNETARSIVGSEEMSGDGSNYRGAQQRTVDGYLCQAWGSGRAEAYNSSTYPDAGLVRNYCRNPYLQGDIVQAKTIWCFTTRPDTIWQECRPIGLIRPVCQDGYAVTSKNARLALEYFAYGLWILAGIYVLLVCCLRKRVRLAVSVTKVAATFIGHTPAVVSIPILQATVSIMWIAAWLTASSFLLSQVPSDYTPTDAYTTFAEAFGTSDVAGKCTNKWPTGGVYKDDNCTWINGTAACWKCSQPRYVFDTRFAASFFVFLWNNAFIIAIGETMIAGAAAVWFFTPNAKKGLRRGSVLTSVKYVLRYHLGSVALGSFIIAVVRFARWILYYIQKQAEAQKNKVLEMTARVLGCCLWCFEKCLKFLNKHAYIQVVIKGTNFCTSAKSAFELILKNAIRFSVVIFLGTILNCVGYIFIVVSTVSLGYLVQTAMHADVDPVMPTILFTIMSYVVASIFLGIFDLAVDSMLQCFLTVESGGTSRASQSEFVPDSLRGLLGLKPEDEDEKELIEKE